MTDLDKVRSYYDGFDEWARLDTPDGQLIVERTCALFDRYLTGQQRILDLACGPGRFAIELARRGHRVAMADLSPRLLAIARERIAEAGVADNIESIDQNNAVDLSIYEDASFDAVLAMGPFYHLGLADQRRTAAGEVARVTKPGGLVFVDFIPRLTGLKWLIERYATDPTQVTVENFSEAVETGFFRNSAGHGFQEGYYAEVDEIRELFESAGFAGLEAVSMRGIASMHTNALWQARQSNPELYAQYMALLDKTAADPQVIATSGNAMYVGRRR